MGKYSDLNDNPNPYANGSGMGTVEPDDDDDWDENGYYNPSLSDADRAEINSANPDDEGYFSDDDKSLSQNVASGLAAVYTDASASSYVATDENPSVQEILIDKGLDDQSIPDSEQR